MQKSADSIHTDAYRDFLKQCAGMISTKAELKYVPSTSEHALKAKAVLNGILETYPEYATTVYALTAYPLQCWAQASRRNLGIDIERIKESLTAIDATGTYFGISTGSGRLEAQKKNLEGTDEIIELIADILADDTNVLGPKQAKCLRCVHTLGDENVSKYYMATWYEDAVLRMCRIYGKQIEEVFKSFKDEKNSKDMDIQVVYHRTDLLIQSLAGFSAIKGGRSDVCGIEAADMIKDCLVAVKSCPIRYKGSELYQATNLFACGLSDAEIADKMEISLTKERKLRENGVKVISYLLWGYSTREIVAGLLNG